MHRGTIARIGLALLGLLVLAVLGCNAGVATSPGTTSTDLEASPTSPTSVPATTASDAGPTPSDDDVDPTRSPDIVGPSPSPGTGSAGMLVQVIVSELIVRSAPGVGSDSIIYPGVIGEGTLLWLPGEPTHLDGYEWHLAVPAEAAFLVADVQSGWIAVASREGNPWVEPTQPDCAGLSTTLGVLESMSVAERFLCFGDRTIEVEGWVPPFFGSGGCGGEEPSWLMCFLTSTVIVDVEPPEAALQPGGAPGWDEGAARLELNFPRGSRPALEHGTHVVATGHFDDPVAQTCGRPDFPDATKIIVEPHLVYVCRGEFVVDSIRSR